MAPKHWNKSHCLTALLRCRIVTWSFIFLKPTQTHQKWSVQGKKHHFQQKHRPGSPQPHFQCTACCYWPCFLGSGGQHAASSMPGHILQDTRHCWRDSITQSMASDHQQPGDMGRVHGQTAARLLHRQKGDLGRVGKIANCCSCVKGVSLRRFNTRALEFNGKIPLASKKEKIKPKSTASFRARWVSVSVMHDMDVQRNQKIIHSVDSAAALRWLKRKVNTN